VDVGDKGGDSDKLGMSRAFWGMKLEVHFHESLVKPDFCLFCLTGINGEDSA